ncbi:MAG: hypothetical protein RLZ72_418 [Actinomycetota bacterium]
MSQYPQDRFDGIDTKSVGRGAHRAPVTRKPWWVKLVTVFASTGVIIVAALAGITVIDARLNFEIPDFTTIGQTPTPTPTPTVVLLDPTTLTEKQFKAITITILNGTTSPTLPTDVASMLTTQNWPQPTFADSSDNTVKQTIVVYRYPADELMAQSIAAALGIETIQQSDAYRGARVYILLGSDFVQ